MTSRPDLSKSSYLRRPFVLPKQPDDFAPQISQGWIEEPSIEPVLNLR
jgi:hypothetical protein